MYRNKKICCIVPARIGSSELVKKNLKKINSTPLFLHAIKKAKKSKYIDKIFFNSDSEYMIKIAKKNGAICDFNRPKYLSNNRSKISEVLTHHFKYYKIEENFDYFILLEPTSPLITIRDIDLAIEKLINTKKASSLLSVTSKTIPNLAMRILKKKNFIKVISDRKLYTYRRQDFKKEYYLGGALYISKTKTYSKFKNFIQPHTTFYEIGKFNIFEIDDEIDFNVVKYLFNNKIIKKNEKNR